MKDIVRELEKRFEALPSEARGSQAEVDALNRLGWALVPVDHWRAQELFERALELSAALSYELGSAPGDFRPGVFRFLQSGLRWRSREGA